jgi:hypothetical protein
VNKGRCAVSRYTSLTYSTIYKKYWFEHRYVQCYIHAPFDPRQKFS